MSWVSPLVLALGVLGAAALAATLTTGLEDQPEYSPVMTDAMRAMGALITVLGVLFGVALLWYAVLEYLP